MIKIFQIADKRKIRKLGMVPIGNPLQFCGYWPATKRICRKRRGRAPPTINGLCDCDDEEKNYKP